MGCEFRDCRVNSIVAVTMEVWSYFRTGFGFVVVVL